MFESLVTIPQNETGLHIGCGYFIAWNQEFGKEKLPSSHIYSFKDEISKIVIIHGYI